MIVAFEVMLQIVGWLILLALAWALFRWTKRHDEQHHHHHHHPPH